MLLPFLFLFTSCTSKEEISPQKEERVILGNEIFIKDFPPELQNKRLGLVINQTSVLPEGKFLVDALIEKERNVKAIFSPEHGFRGAVEGGKEIKEDIYKGIKIYSLYGETKKPTLEQTQNIDAFIYDIQDVGARFYTYITTLKYVMESAAEAKKAVYVLDRPNPLGGNIIEGPLLLPEYETFIGAFPIPIRYGLTVGELAKMMKGEGWVPEDIDLHVVKIKNWNRNDFWKDTELPWIPTSPNIPNPESAIVYPGIGLLEALNLNEGRGTPFPFLLYGSPWLDTLNVIADLNEGKPFGVKLSTVVYTPVSLPGKALHPRYEGTQCQGIRIDILREEDFRALRFALSAFKSIRNHHPKQFSSNPRRLNIMYGNNQLGLYIQGKISYENLMKSMEKDENLFREKRDKYLLYE